MGTQNHVNKGGHGTGISSRLFSVSEGWNNSQLVDFLKYIRSLLSQAGLMRPQLLVYSVYMYMYVCRQIPEPKARKMYFK